MYENRLFIFGYGYSARALTALLAREGGWAVHGTSRSIDGDLDIGLSAWPGSDIIPDLNRSNHVLVSIPPVDGSDIVEQFLAGNAHRLRLDRIRWVGYLSTTAVYGDHDGGWVDEDSELNPATDRGKARVSAEGAWQELAARHGFAINIFRLAGIYGPGRGPVSQLVRGRTHSIIKPGQIFNRIHVEDIAGMLRSTMSDPHPGRVYNVCDDLPERPERVLSHAASLLGFPEPEPIPFEQANLSPMARSFYSESKRVSNARIKAETGYVLKYPDYFSGMKACVAAL